jgi:hypothetical protein
MKTHGDKSMLGKSQTNNLDGTPTIANTGKGMTGKSVSESTEIANANIRRLAKHIRHQLAEGAKALRGNYGLEFSIVVTEGGLPDFLKKKGKDAKAEKGKKGKKPPFTKGKKNETKKQDRLAEALADVEEMLQIHDVDNVAFQATYRGPQGQIALKQNIPLFTITPRGPLVGEGKALFRFKRHAEAFAEALSEEGVTSRVLSHNWGSAVQARTNYQTAANAFAVLAEGNV